MSPKKDIYNLNITNERQMRHYSMYIPIKDMNEGILMFHK